MSFFCFGLLYYHLVVMTCKLIRADLSNCLQLADERLLLPQGVSLLLVPIFALGVQFEVERIENFSHDEAHLVVSQAGTY